MMTLIGLGLLLLIGLVLYMMDVQKGLQYKLERLDYNLVKLHATLAPRMRENNNRLMAIEYDIENISQGVDAIYEMFTEDGPDDGGEPAEPAPDEPPADDTDEVRVVEEEPEKGSPELKPSLTNAAARPLLQIMH